jgi:hypothetical protein
MTSACACYSFAPVQIYAGFMVLVYPIGQWLVKRTQRRKAASKRMRQFLLLHTAQSHD